MIGQFRGFSLLPLLLALALTMLQACEGSEAAYPTPVRKRGEATPRYSYGETRIGQPSVFNEGGLFGRLSPDRNSGAGGIGVNNFLWRASLDSIAFMPLASADPFGGVILTDWYALPEAPSERLKVNLFIVGRELRADGIRAAVFRQRREANGNWVDMTIEEGTSSRLEDAILTRARELRLAQ